MSVSPPRRRPRLTVLFWLWLVLGVGNLGRAGYRLAVRDDLWGLAVAIQGLSGLIFIGLALRAWRNLRRFDDTPATGGAAE